MVSKNQIAKISQVGVYAFFISLSLTLSQRSATKGNLISLSILVGSFCLFFVLFSLSVHEKNLSDINPNPIRLIGAFTFVLFISGWLYYLYGILPEKLEFSNLLITSVMFLGGYISGHIAFSGDLL